MNIFATNKNPDLAAQDLDDLRLNKMILETAQILCTVAQLHNYQHPSLYKLTHPTHPCTLWAYKSYTNFYWLCQYFDSLALEYTWRKGKTHKSYEEIAPIIKVFLTTPNKWEVVYATPFANCSKENDKNIHKAYKKCLVKKWANDIRQPTWTKRGEPRWLKKYL